MLELLSEFFTLWRCVEILVVTLMVALCYGAYREWKRRS